MKEKNMVFGIRAVIEALRVDKEFDKIFVRRDMSSELSRELHAALQGRQVPIVKVPVEKLNRITAKNHQGVIAFISPITFQRIEDILPSLFENGQMPFIVALDCVTDVRNFGAIARTCECAGVDAIVVPLKGAAAVNADAIKTSAGALFSIPVCREPDFNAALKYMQNSGLSVIAATEKAVDSYTTANYKNPFVLLMGAEDTGIAPENLRLCDQMVRIPLQGSIASLNVSVATGVLIFEALRQRS